MIDNDTNCVCFLTYFNQNPHMKHFKRTGLILGKYIIVFFENTTPIKRKVFVVKWATKLLPHGCPTQTPVV